ncbi:MAG: hypothetical protein RL172_1821 [Bacteroidota bacterium]|jgi:peptidoglycan LD-endopeptidase LytH
MMSRLQNILLKHQPTFYPVVPFAADTQQLLALDFTAANTGLTPGLLKSTQLLSDFIAAQLNAGNYQYGIGGYNENRVLYQRSTHFNGDEPRSIHLGIDIWGAAGTPVFAPMGGMVHSVAFNNHFGDYGATIILQHQLDTVAFHTLYGHVSLGDIAALSEGMYVNRGQQIAQFGTPEENGDWPPHLHFQIIEDMELKEGDYPGVCSQSEREKYLLNCPDADLILQLMQHT